METVPLRPQCSRGALAVCQCSTEQSSENTQGRQTPSRQLCAPLLLRRISCEVLPRRQDKTRAQRQRAGGCLASREHKACLSRYISNQNIKQVVSNVLTVFMSHTGCHTTLLLGQGTCQIGRGGIQPCHRVYSIHPVSAHPK